MKSLKIGDSFTFPIELVTSTQAILARKRSGKSYTASVEAEELLSAHQQIAVIDPTGAWHGLKSSADGEHPGFPVVVFGGEHADVPLEPSAGETVARALVERGFSAIFDVSLMGVAEAIRFVSAFTTQLFHLNREAMHLFIDEADAYAPERPFGEETKSLSAIKRLVKQGGIRGIGVTMISQRPQQLAKSILSQVDILTVLRMSHPLDIKAATDWISSEVTPEFAAEVKAALPSLPVGTAFICSAPLAIGERVEIRKRTTFNSGATPKPGEKRIQPKALAHVDIEKLGEEIKATVERAKADDPKALRQRIAQLESEAKRAPQAVAAPVPGKTIELRPDPEAIEKIVRSEVQTFFDTFRKKIAVRIMERLEAAAFSLDADAERLRDFSKTLNVDSTWQFKDFVTVKPTAFAKMPMVAGATAPELSKVPTRPTPIHQVVPILREDSGAPISPAQRRILQALGKGLSINKDQLSRTWTGLLAGASPKSSSFTNNLGALRTAGLIEYPQPNMLRITETGLNRIGVESVTAPMKESELHDRIIDMLVPAQQRIMNSLLDRRGAHLGREALATGAGSSASSSSFTNNLGALRSLGLIDYAAGGMVFACSDLFID